MGGQREYQSVFQERCLPTLANKAKHMKEKTMNLALQGGMDTFSKAIDAVLVTRHHTHIDIEYLPSELEIQVVNQATCEHEIKVEADEAYCPRCLKHLTVADFVAED